MNALSQGWADERLAYLYHQLEQVRDGLPNGSTEAGCISDALKAVELADVFIEKRIKEDATPELLETLIKARDAANELELSSAYFPRVEIEAAIAKARGEA